MPESSIMSYLRLMDESDLSQVYDIELKSYDYPWSLSGFEKSLDQGLNYVFCDVADNILGYCCILPVLDEANILNICVSPKYQRRGVAKQAFSKILDTLQASNYQIVFLEVRESNSAAQKLYQSLGFTQDGIRKGYYRSQAWDEDLQELVDEKEDAILMSYSFAG
ncbi:ribosomal-protein-alanine acetyltransferase [Thiomicrorhabdus immobilis]|uniref:Ribosomal-protein-alanine acetyltransferase n=1 Tax=Thiomicrorhabdus immobilis TaxID=2791037 RepID=A0ABM7MEI7_9GAMM|nr:ribosomal protein S18-alanine N-acetyltransferase [Thiomicrorhabdus immobilis]BCN93820.1 ribosomal-protein-alanine acetyltransferase [Thiomicrorhabdus immobilis]